MDLDQNNIVFAPKTGTFQMRINTEVKKAVEEIYAAQGLTLTDAVNVFFQQSLNAGGLPFLASAENEEFVKSKALSRFLNEIETGLESARKEGWVSEEDSYRILGVDK